MNYFGDAEDTLLDMFAQWMQSFDVKNKLDEKKATPEQTETVLRLRQGEAMHLGRPAVQGLPSSDEYMDSINNPSPSITDYQRKLAESYKPETLQDIFTRLRNGLTSRNEPDNQDMRKFLLKGYYP